MARQRILRSTAATISATFRDQDGEPKAPTGAVAASIVPLSGATTITGAGSLGGTSGAVSYTLTPAQTATLDILNATFTDSVGVVASTSVEIVGGYYFSVSEARASDKTLDDTQKYPDADIIAARTAVEVECEWITWRAFVPRFRQLRLISTGAPRLPLRDPEIRVVRSLKVDGATIPDSTLSTFSGFGGGVLEWPYTRQLPSINGAFSYSQPFGFRGSQLTVSYEYGWDSPPEDLRLATLTRLRSLLNRSKSGVPDRAVSYTAENGATYSLTTPGMRGAHTGIPDVDEAYSRYTFETESFSAPLI